MARPPAMLHAKTFFFMVKRMVFSPIKILSTSQFAIKERLLLISFTHSLKKSAARRVP
ncbi:hypothetical protein [Noviherbaspirillum soli]|uniref:hypothetical protein n=1 Tax=Noviherbaspirillum soli TaxID=1064518 RepID=UPI001E3DB372|nr:hypothetical protein [Noviherbaspirillum soli]